MENFTYTLDIQKELDKITSDVITNVSERVSTEMREHILNTIYSPPPSTWYKRHYDGKGFLDSWELSDLNKKANTITRSVFFNGNKLALPDTDNKGYSHGSPANDGNYDFRFEMPYILNSGSANVRNSSFGGARYPNTAGSQGYWDSFIDYLNKNIYTWFDEEFEKYGITRR